MHLHIGLVLSIWSGALILNENVFYAVSMILKQDDKHQISSITQLFPTTCPLHKQKCQKIPEKKLQSKHQILIAK